MSHEEEINGLWTEFLSKVLSDEEDDEVIRAFGELTDTFLNDLNSEDFEINPPQWLKLMHIIEVLSEYADKHNGEVLPVQLVPQLEAGGVTAEYPLIYFSGKEIFDVAEMLCDTSAVSIDAKTDGTVCVSINVPHVFKRKAK